MSRVVWKYIVDTAEQQSIDLPVGAQILDLRTQGGVPHLWALVDPAADTETRHFLLLGTGVPIYGDQAVEYIGTVHLAMGTLVFHLFEVID